MSGSTATRRRQEAGEAIESSRQAIRGALQMREPGSRPAAYAVSDFAALDRVCNTLDTVAADLAEGESGPAVCGARRALRRLEALEARLPAAVAERLQLASESLNWAVECMRGEDPA